MSVMSVDIWSAPLAEPVMNLGNTEDEGGARAPKRRSLFLSDSEDEDNGSRQRASSPATSPPKDGDELAAPETSKLDAMFADIDDDDVFDIEPAIDLEKMKRQADARVAARTAAAKSLMPFDEPGDGSSPKQDKDKEKGRKVKRAIPKLDEERLLGTDGFPRLIKDCKNFKNTGKGNEAADLERLFRLYHVWTHKMYPKFQFKDTVERVEKLCRSRRMAVNLRAWKDEANGIGPEVRYEVTQDDEGETGEADEDEDGSVQGHRAPPSSSPASSSPGTPVTRPGSAASTALSVPSSATSNNDGMDIDIDALLQEEEEMMREINGTVKGGTSYKPSVPDEDDDDALWAATGGISEEMLQPKIIGLVPPSRDEVEDDDLWDIAAEMEAQPQATSLKPSSAGNDGHKSAIQADGSVPPADGPAEPRAVGGDWDDMYA